MFKQSLFALAAASTVLAAAIPEAAEARTRRTVQTVSSSRVFQGRDGRYYCRRGNGTIGLVVGGVGGALIGRSIDSHGDRLPGTLIGAAAGALVGREVEKRVRCR